ncbi:hypothetical protein B0T26DRAFT_255501 [Lasiosphaeria miniovina]|uniref:BTB domain-containing protein n=1 Tax=Lasiosphaeria miniovina TaxID=1954250 RepID=A0AA40AWE8_9PEZI|nr:uncharacterized protein B0T26DRAFT_255501 [Lasiosphaeria miniovina]KAK0723219.1 hypothetical protein B0T26DRAFT_255501 [Lasiosphaeria miniovina]
MVSHQHGGDVSTSLTVRGSASVVGAGAGSDGRGSASAGASLSGRTAGSGNGGGGGSHVSSRARRYNRSHAGGVAFVPQNEFPVFSHSGDVEIVVRVASGHENRYLLHRHTLTRCSGFFEASTSKEWSRAQTVPDVSLSPAPPAVPAIEAASGSNSNGNGNSTGAELARIDDRSNGGNGSGSEGGSTPRPMGLGPLRKRWRYELDTGTGDNDIPMLVQKPESSGPPTAGSLTSPSSIFGGPSPSSRHHHSSSGSGKPSRAFFRSVANLSLSSTHHAAAAPLEPPTHAEQDLLRDYDNLFRIMYNYPPYLDGINIADAYVQCKSLLTLADQYDALAVVGPRVDHHLLQFQSRLWRQIAKYPISYLRLGYLARSKVMFQEALIHVVGQWPAGERSIRAAMPDTVLDIIEDKVDELEETISRIEARLFRLTLTNPRSGERVTPATNYLDWLAVSLFRQWLADNTTPPMPPIPDRTRGAGGHRDAAGGGSRARVASNSSSSNASAAGAGHGRSSGGGSGGGGGGGGPGHGVLVAPVPPLASLGKTYRILGGAAAGTSSASPDKGYLAHDECKRFLKLTPDLYSRDNLRRFEKRVDELKAMAREVVRPLMGTGLELELGAGGAIAPTGIAYLTCTTLADRDLPWLVYD